MKGNEKQKKRLKEKEKEEKQLKNRTHVGQRRGIQYLLHFQQMA
jgi:hypothetical protein